MYPFLLGDTASTIGTLAPIGTITGMLVAVFVIFMKDNARNDERHDVITAKMVAQADADRDRAIEALRLVEERHAQDMRRLRDEQVLSKQMLYDRIAVLERLVYNEERTVRPTDVPPSRIKPSGAIVSPPPEQEGQEHG